MGWPAVGLEIYFDQEGAPKPCRQPGELRALHTGGGVGFPAAAASGKYLKICVGAADHKTTSWISQEKLLSLLLLRSRLFLRGNFGRL